MATIFDSLLDTDSLVEEIDEIVTGPDNDTVKVARIDALIEEFRKN